MKRIMKRTSVRHAVVRSFGFGLGEVFACDSRMYAADRRRCEAAVTHECTRCQAAVRKEVRHAS